MLPLNTPVVLIKRIVTPSGNVIDSKATPYQLGEIPSAYRTEEYIVYTAQVEVKPVQFGDVVINYKPLEQNGIEQTKEFKIEPVEIKVTSFDLEVPEELKESEVDETPVLEKRVNINEASAEEIAQLKMSTGRVGAKTANRVVKNREENGNYKDLADLNSRVKLAFGDNWFMYKDVVYF